MAALHLQPGDRVLDLGCGIGGTPIALAEAVGSSGRVVGLELLQSAVDVSRADPGLPETVTFICGDAETYPMPPAAFDAVFSRFGVMFFTDSIRAFRNIRSALRPGGRLGFVCWRAFEENELDSLPLQAASAHLPHQLVEDAMSSGWFSFSDPETLRSTLSAAGFVGVEVIAHDEPVCCGSLQETLDVCTRVGALGAILRDHPHLLRDAIPALEKGLLAINGPAGPRLRAATWIVSGRAPTD